MKNMECKSILTVALALMLSLLCLTGCSQGASNTGAAATSGGILYLRVNPEIAVTYDAAGNVTKVDARNNDGSKILNNYTGYEGKSCRQVITELVTAIGNAGYFVEEIDGDKRQITIEIESGSKLPHDTFLNEVVSDVRNCVNSNNWQSPIELEGESNYGMANYVDTDYGPNNDGVTDYNNSGANYNDTDYGPNNDGVTDYNNSGANYNDTDYGPNNDGVTDYNSGVANYNDTDYGPNNDGVTDYNSGMANYNDTDYGPNNDGVTDYNSGVANYNDTDYGPNNDGVTDYNNSAASYNDTDYGPNNDGITDYNSGVSNYNSGSSNYGNSNYGGGNGDSAYN